MPDVVELISPQALMFSPNSPGTDTMDLHDSLQSGSVMVRSVVFLILKQILKNPDTYIFSIELLCFVGDSPQGGGMESGEKSLIWPCKDFRRILKKDYPKAVYPGNF